MRIDTRSPGRTDTFSNGPTRTDVPALVAVLRELRGLALVGDESVLRLSAFGWRDLILRLTGGDAVRDDVEDPPTAWINEGLVGEMGAPG